MLALCGILIIILDSPSDIINGLEIFLKTHAVCSDSAKIIQRQEGQSLGTAWVVNIVGL